MALIEQLPALEAAQATARALEQLLGHDVILTVGDALIGEPSAAALPDEPTRSVALPFGNGILGEVTLVVAPQFATSMEAATPSASLVAAAIPALQAAAGAIEPHIHLQALASDAGEIATATLLSSLAGDFAIVPVLENDARVACVVLRIVEDTPLGVLDVEALPDSDSVRSITVDAVVAPTAMALVPDDITVHEFQSLSDGIAIPAQARPLSLLNDVRMEVIAELGRRRMKVRDLVALRPGSVVELDRAAGSPIDVLVNGALIAHGEVVVIDEEFGIRVSEIIVGEG